MAVKLCYHCSHVINEGNKVCPGCGIDLESDGAVIEVAGDLKGYNYVSTTSAYQDENLLNFNEDSMDDDDKKEIFSLNRVISEETEEDIFGREHYEFYKEFVKFVQTCLHVLRHPRRYSAYVLGMMGCILMIVGSMFCTYYCDDNGLVKESFLKRDSFFMILFAIAGIILIIEKIQKYVIVPMIFSAIILIDLVYCFYNIDDFVKVGSGFIIWSVSTIFVICSVFLLKIQNMYVIDEKNKDAQINRYDHIWILIVILVASGLVKNISNHNFDSPIKQTTSNANATVKMVLDDGEAIILLHGAYETQYKNKDIAIISLTLKNNTNKSIYFDNIFTINVYQNSRELYADSNVLIDGVDMAARNTSVEENDEKKMFFVYYLDNSEDIVLNIKKIGEEATLILKETLKLENDLSLISSFNVENNGVGEDKELNEKTNGSEQTDQSEINKQTWDIYFTKPAYWGEKIYIYISWYHEDAKAYESFRKEWPGTLMSEWQDGVYKYSYGEEEFNTYRIIISDELNHVYPEDEKGMLLTGNMDIRP